MEIFTLHLCFFWSSGLIVTDVVVISQTNALPRDH